MGRTQIRSLNTKKAPWIFGSTSKNRERCLWGRNPTVYRPLKWGYPRFIEHSTTGPTENRIKSSRKHHSRYQKRYCLYCNKFGRKMKRDKWQQTRKNSGRTNNNASNTLKYETCGKPHKTEVCWHGANSVNDPRHKRHNQQERKTDNSVQPTTFKTVDESKNLLTPGLRFGETADAWAYSREDPPSNTTTTPQQNATEHKRKTGWEDQKSLP